MRMATTGAGVALLLMLGACGGNGTENVTDIEVPEGNYVERLRTMEPELRDATFLRAIRDAGRDCQGVTASSYQGETSGAPTWTATCDDGVQWIIVLGADGIAQVVNAAELQAAQ